MASLLLTLLVALAYTASGWLALQIAVPPGYVSLVFLPAGLALGVVLVWGARTLSGIVLGSLCVQMLAGLQSTGMLPWHGWSNLVPALGAALQAWATAALVRRWIGYPTALDTPQHVVLFLFVLAPLGSLLNASLSVPVLVWDGLMHADEALYNAWVWWLGDTMGVALGAPIVLVLFGQPASAWRSRMGSVVLPMALAALVVGASYHELHRLDQQAQQAQFQQRAQDLAQRLQRRLDAQTDSVVAVATLMRLTTQHDAHTFREAVQPWLQRYPATQNFGWSPRITRAQRPGYEARESRQRGSAFQVLGRTPGGQTHRAADAPEHLPITWVEPLASNRTALGLDVLVLHATATTVERTRLSGQPAVSPSFRLVQETGAQQAVVMYQVVRGQPLTADQGPGGPTVGVVSAVFRLDAMLASVVGPGHAQRLQVCLLDADAPLDQRHLAGHAGCQHRASRMVTPTFNNQWHSQIPLYFGDRHWQLHVRPGPGYHSAEAENWFAWVTVITGLVSVTLLGAFLLIVSGHSRRAQHLVEQRTQELAQSNTHLEQLVHFDPLTGLVNRPQWMVQAHATLEAARHDGSMLGVVFLDLDHFKHINDSLGHSQGDLLLKTVADRLRQCLRPRDVLARLSGDEFVVLLPRLKSRTGAEVAARKILQALAAPIELGHQEITVSASLGLALYPADGADIETLLRHADTAMYSVKGSGRNGWRHFSRDMNEHLSQRLQIESGLRRALQPGANELILEYQPQVDTRSGAVVGVEALLRWRPPGQGPIGPDQFIPVAEDSGLIEPLSQWVLQQACTQLQQWQAQASTHPELARLKMAVNISAMEFNRANFMVQLRGVIERSGIVPAQLELEITESLLIQVQPSLQERLLEITAMGLSLALDDFGTGYSSLGYLKRLPLSKLKIDKSFITDVPGNAEDEAIIRATLSIAHDLGLQVVAEGVETQAQREFLLAHQCDTLQGWLYSRALPASEMPGWLRRHAQAWQRDHDADPSLSI